MEETSLFTSISWETSIIETLSGWGSKEISTELINPNILTNIIESFWGIWMLLGGVIFFLWIVALIRVIKDSTARSNSFWFQFFALLCIIVLTPIFGLPLYLALRPAKYKEEQYARKESLVLQSHYCLNCHTQNLLDHSFCTHCGDALKGECRECEELYSKNHEYCPYCGAPNIE